MTLHQAEQALSSQSVAFTVEQECVLVSDGQTPHARTVSRHLQRCDGDVARVERTVNRRFVVAHLLDPLMERPLSAVSDVTPPVCEAIGRIAEAYAKTLHEALNRAFPARTFEVEVVGGDYVAEEPLEVCVTFYSG